MLYCKRQREKLFKHRFVTRSKFINSGRHYYVQRSSSTDREQGFQRAPAFTFNAGERKMKYVVGGCGGMKAALKKIKSALLVYSAQ